MNKAEYSHNLNMVETIKDIIRKMLALKERPKENYSVYISKRLHLNYTYLASVFSETSNITIEHFIIHVKIESAVEMLSIPGNSIKNIASVLFYSSMGHFSNQFKKMTGVSPSVYRRKYLPAGQLNPQE